MTDTDHDTDTDLFRRYREGDGPGLNRAFNAIFGLQRSDEEWRWKYTPEARRRALLLAEEDGEILACYAALPVPLQVDGRRFLAAQVVDSFSNRRPGLYVKLVNAFYDRLCGPGAVELTYGFPGGRHLRLGELKLRYCPGVPVGFLARSVLPAAGFRRRLSRRLLGYRLVEAWSPRDADGLWARVAGRYPLAAVRDGRWLERRFLSRPGVAYRSLAVRRRGRLAAWAVVRPPAAGGGSAGEDPAVLSWADLVWDGDPQALELLDDGVAEIARRTGARESHLWLANDPAGLELLASRSWAPRPEPHDLHLTAVAHRPDLEAHQVARRLYVTMADCDLI